MCQELIAPRRYCCKHTVDPTLGFLVPWLECNGCGNAEITVYLGERTLRDPCENCREAGLYAQFHDQWMPKGRAEEKRRDADLVLVSDWTFRDLANPDMDGKTRTGRPSCVLIAVPKSLLDELEEQKRQRLRAAEPKEKPTAPSKL